MDWSHIFYKEIPADDDNIFFANLSENNEVEEVLLKKDQNCMATCLSINWKAETDVIITDLNARHSLSDMIRSHKEERKTINLDCYFYKKRFIWYNYPF